MSDALSNVEVLYELPLIDSQPSVEGASNAIVYEANFDTNFEDKAAYITGISKYIEEAVLHSNLVCRAELRLPRYTYLSRIFYSNKAINMQWPSTRGVAVHERYQRWVTTVSVLITWIRIPLFPCSLSTIICKSPSVRSNLSFPLISFLIFTAGEWRTYTFVTVPERLRLSSRSNPQSNRIESKSTRKQWKPYNPKWLNWWPSCIFP